MSLAETDFSVPNSVTVISVFRLIDVGVVKVNLRLLSPIIPHVSLDQFAVELSRAPPVMTCVDPCLGAPVAASMYSTVIHRVRLFGDIVFATRISCVMVFVASVSVNSFVVVIAIGATMEAPSGYTRHAHGVRSASGSVALNVGG